MLKKFLSLAVTGFVAFALFACGDSDSSSQAPEQDTPQVGAESSSSQAGTGSSSSEGPASPDPLESSSSEAPVSKAVQDSLPFDTTGIEAVFYTYTYDQLDFFTPEQRAADGADSVLGYYINALTKVPPFCPT